jgi:hypothetical protein
MSERPKTIQIFLPGGDPRGIRVAEITTRIVQVIEVPRSLLQDFLKMPKSDQVALYFLFGETEDGSEQKVYVGQTGDLRARLVAHNRDRDKDFWERALVLISRTKSLITNHTQFLEWYCIQQIRKAARYADLNGNSGSRPHTPGPLEEDCFEIFEVGQILLATLGYPVFDPVAKPPGHQTADALLFCTSSGVNGRGQYTEEGFVVLKDSVGRSENVPSIRGTADERFRNRLIEDGAMRVEGETVVFTKDRLFGSPSMAAVALLGRTANGWLEWKTDSGKTLDAVKRQTPES